MKAGDPVYEDDGFEMDEGSIVQLEIADPLGRPYLILTTTGCTDFKIPSCDDKNFKWDVKKGKYFWESNDWNLHYIGTQNCSVKNVGTKYSIETGDNEDIIKLYEGSAVLYPQKFKSIASEELQKLSEDYRNGKISMEEFMSKSKGLSDEILKNKNTIMDGIKLEAGYQVAVGETIGEIIPISADDNKWWDNQNFNK